MLTNQFSLLVVLLVVVSLRNFPWSYSSQKCEKSIPDNTVVSFRSVAWEDNTVSVHGTLLEEYIGTDFVILNGPEPTFLAKNGSSVIDLIICWGSICDIPHRSSVDYDVELFSGAPNRGHIPVTVEFDSVSEPITMKSKPWIEKTNWDNWSFFLEQRSCTVPSNQADELWIFIRSLFAHASQYFIPSKTVSKHSKPFWNTELEEASKSLRKARRKFKHNSNYSNGEELKEKRDLSERICINMDTKSTGAAWAQKRERILEIS